MQIQNAVITGSFSYNGTDLSSVTSSTSNITSLNAITASIFSTTASLNTASGSAITRLSALEVTSGSNITRISALETASGSTITRLSSIESKTGSYATTGSNTFVDGQYLSSSFNPTGFSTTASLYTDGGLRVTRDAYISGTLYLNNVTVYGTQSVCYITSSQLNISNNLISVNTSTPSVRFGGLAVYDSGSTGLTGSILWDSEANHWVYSNPSGSSYSGGMFISGPRTSTLGSETGTTSCMLLAGQGGDHLTSSMIYHDSTTTCIPNTLIGGAACFSNVVCVGANLVVRSAATFCDTVGLFGGSSQLYIGGSSAASDFVILSWCATNKSLNIRNQSIGNSGQLVVTCEGNVVIGDQTALGSKLTIVSANDQAGITMYNTYDCNKWSIRTGTSGINNKGIGIVDDICNLTRLQIDGAGNVGIGSSCTVMDGYNTKLRVTCIPIDTFVFAFNNYACKPVFRMYGGNGGNPQGYTAWIDNTSGNTNHQISHNTAETTFFASQGGNVGIGTSTPSTKLEIKGTNTYHKIAACFFSTYNAGFAFSDYLAGLTYDAGGNNFCIYSNYANYGGIILSTATNPRLFIHACGGVNIASGGNFVSVQRHNFEVGDIKGGGGFALCTINIPQSTWSTFACVTDGDTNIVVDFTYVNSNDFNRSGAILSRWAYNGGCAGLYIVNCAYNWSQNISSLDFRNNGGALQVYVAGGGGTYKVQARIQGARATG